ncbi:MAG: RNA polymerase sigma factor [Thermodesulfobacteriota bacterium]|nr:MAG: RNA polymerase sigma factor [Thermodesulfobacteriota bacterium]
MNINIEIDNDTIADEEVVRRVLAGEVALFEIIMRRYNQRLYRVTRGILRDAVEAEDVMQNAYVNAYTHLNQFAGLAKFSTWLTRIAVNEALTHIRNRKRFVNIDSTYNVEEETMNILSPKTPDPEEQVIAKELNVVLEAAVDSLPEAFRSVFLLRKMEGMSTAETAECLDISEQNVKIRLHRARVLLREEISASINLAAPDAFQFGGKRCDRVVVSVLKRINSGLL